MTALLQSLLDHMSPLESIHRKLLQSVDTAQFFQVKSTRSDEYRQDLWRKPIQRANILQQPGLQMRMECYNTDIGATDTL